MNGNSKRAGGSQHAVVVAGQLYGLTLLLKKIDGCQMDRVEGSDRSRKWFQRSYQDHGRELDQGHPAKTARTSSAWDRVSFRAWIRFQSSYSSNRLEMSGAFQSSSGGETSSASM
jgi:hypothetical protein